MTNPKISTGFSKLSDSNLLLKGTYIHTSLTGNVNFTTPTPTLPELQVGIDNFDDSINNSVEGNKADTALKNQYRDELIELLNNAGLYVQLNGKNNENILLSSGFDLQKTKSSIGALPKAQNIKVMPGEGVGTVKVSFSSIVGADSYLYEYTAAPVTTDSVWVPVTSTKTNLIIENLTSGKQYAFKVAGVGSDPSQVFSDILFSFIL